MINNLFDAIFGTLDPPRDLGLEWSARREWNQAEHFQQLTAKLGPFFFPIIQNSNLSQAARRHVRSKALQFITDRVPSDGVESIAVLHAGAPDIDEFMERLRPKLADAEIIVGHVGPVVGVHAGPRVLGCAWITRA